MKRERAELQGVARLMFPVVPSSLFRVGVVVRHLTCSGSEVWLVMAGQVKTRGYFSTGGRCFRGRSQAWGSTWVNLYCFILFVCLARCVVGQGIVSYDKDSDTPRRDD